MEEVLAIQEPATFRGAGPAAPGAPRIYYASPLLCGPLQDWPAVLDRVARLGFDHLLIAPPFAPGRTGSLFLAADFARLHPLLAWERDAAAGLRWLADECRARDLRLLMDVVPDRLAAGSVAAREAEDLFAGPEGMAALDPRHGHGGSEAARARFKADGLVPWWTARLAGWAEAGISGFRLLRLAHAPAAFTHDLLAALRDRAPECLTLGWTPGLSDGAVRALEGSGLDFVFSSLPWWDFAGDWFWPETERLARVAPIITAPEAPFGDRLYMQCHDPVAREPVYRRALAFAASLGTGWMMPMGFEIAASQALDPARDCPEDWATAEANAPFDLGAAVASVNAARAAARVVASAAPPRPLTGPGGAITAVLRTDAADVRHANLAMLIVANGDAYRHASVQAAPLLAAAGGFPSLSAVLPPDHGDIGMADTIILGPAAVLAFDGAAARPRPLPRPPLPETASTAAQTPRVAIEAVTPSVDGGLFPVKRIVGEIIAVEADVLADGHEVVSAVLRWRPRGEPAWRERRMRPLGNDRWHATFPLELMATYEFAVEAWRDAFATWRDELAKKHAAGVDTTLEIREGLHLVADAAMASHEKPGGALQALANRLAPLSDEDKRALLLSRDTSDLMEKADQRPFAVRTPAFPVQAERIGAQFASWYEIFPRSMSDDPDRHGTFADVIRHLPRIRDMGFDVLYFPPIHPIGQKNRKGRNNALRAAPDDPGSPYAIGSAEGGHDAIHPMLGTLEDFRRLGDAAAAHGLELAIDFAIQCSPDHPWLTEHREWFAWRPDGTIKYAENPPKKYEDIVNVHFYAPGAIPDLWVGLCEVVMFWAEQGVRLFRVDNPHTKPFPFWEWMIAEVRARFPDAVFLAEAFTRPKVMYRLAKIGFSQSYTYFTWRNTKQELQDYLVELNETPQADFFRPHFFVNTPDINPLFLQTSGRAGFLIRAALAATLAGLWGVYCGFELCEATPLPGREEYLDSEKYQIRAWDWQRPGNIVAEITRLNEIRRANPALHTHLGLTFHTAHDDSIIYYEKATPDRSNVLLIAINLDPHNAREAAFEAPLWQWSLPDSGALEVEDLVHGGRFVWHGKMQRVRLERSMPYAIWRARPET